ASHAHLGQLLLQLVGGELVAVAPLLQERVQRRAGLLCGGPGALLSCHRQREVGALLQGRDLGVQVADDVGVVVGGGQLDRLEVVVGHVVLLALVGGLGGGDRRGRRSRGRGRGGRGGAGAPGREVVGVGGAEGRAGDGVELGVLVGQGGGGGLEDVVLVGRVVVGRAEGLGRHGVPVEVDVLDRGVDRAGLGLAPPGRVAPGLGDVVGQ